MAIIEKVKCPYCDKYIEATLPDPEEYTYFEGGVRCDECGKDVELIVLPKFSAKPVNEDC